jgi:DNA oxidative demethylase
MEATAIRQRIPLLARLPSVPVSVLDIWRAVASHPHLPEACLVNFYDSSAKMGLHQDRDEAELAAPVVSISLGDSCSFSLWRLTPDRSGKKA